MTPIFAKANGVLQAAALSACLAVVFGAFGAHGLKPHLDVQMMQTYQTAVQYHFYHSLALLANAILLKLYVDSTLLLKSAFLFVIGIVLFSGSLYLMALSGIRWLGIITPLGGLSFIMAWLCLWFAAVKEFR